MRLLVNKELPRLKINPCGRIENMNTPAHKLFKDLEIGNGVFDIIDADVIRKLSMYNKKIELVETYYEKFPLALLKISGETRTKSIDVIFYPEGVIKDDLRLDAKHTVGLLLDKNMSKANTCINAFDSIKFIFDELCKRKELFGLNVKIEAENNFYAKLGHSQAELLFLASALVVGEINPNANLKININKGRVELSLETVDRCIANSITELLYFYPQLVPKLLLIESICEDEFIKIKINKRINSLRIVYVIPRGKENELVIKLGKIDSRQRISDFIDMLSAKSKEAL